MPGETGTELPIQGQEPQGQIRPDTPEQSKKPELELPEGVSEHDLVPKKDMLKEPGDEDYDIFVHEQTGHEYRAEKGQEPGINQGYWPKEKVSDEDIANSVATREGNEIVYRNKEGEILAKIPAVTEGGAGTMGVTPEREAELRQEKRIIEDEGENIRIEKGLRGNAFTEIYDQVKQRDPNVPEQNPSWVSAGDIEDLDLRKKVVDSFKIYEKTAEEYMRGNPEMGRRIPEARSVVDLNALPTFQDIYQELLRDGKVSSYAGQVEDVKDLGEQDKRTYLKRLAENPDRPLDLYSIINEVVENPSAYYPGQDLSIIYRIDQKLGLGGDAVRKRVEQVMAGEEYDDTKEMRQEQVGQLFNSIGQYLSADQDLQQELRVSIYIRLKLHGSTILARYVGVDKLAQQMPNFYQDEMRVLMDTSLFKEASMMLESEQGAYFRDGKGFEDKNLQENYENSKRYSASTMKMALLLMPVLPDSAFDKKSSEYCGFSREELIEVARQIVERNNLANKEADGIQDKEAKDRKYIGTNVAIQQINPARKDELIALFKKSNLENSDFSYNEAEIVYLLQEKLNTDTQKLTPVKTAIEILSRSGMIKRSHQTENGEVEGRLTKREVQELTDLLNEANRAFGLNIKVFDIFGRSAEYTGLIDKKGNYIRPEAKLKLPGDMTWINLVDHNYFKLELAQRVDSIRSKYEALYPGKDFHSLTDEQKKGIYKDVATFIKPRRFDENGAKELEKIFAPVIQRSRGLSADLKNVDKIAAGSEEEAILEVTRDLEGIAIRDTQAKANREFVVAKWNEIDRNETNPFRKGAREYRKAMWNQILLTGLNKDTKGKAFLRRFASTDVISLMQNSARKSVLDQMAHWNDDFQNMKKHSDALTTGAQLRIALTDKEPGLFNSTTKLNNPTEHLRAIKDILFEWTQEHRVDYMDFISGANLLYLAKYNRENEGYRNAGIVRLMGLAQEMIDGSVLRKRAKEAVEATLYFNKYVAQTMYTFTKAAKGSAIFGLLKDIFTGSTKGIFQS